MTEHLQHNAADKRRALRDGAMYTVSLTPSYLVFGMVCGVSSKQTGMDALQAFAFPAFVFGGSSQIVLTQMLLGGAPLFVAILSAAIVNLRMGVYSAALSQRLLRAPQRVRTAVAPFLVDQTFAYLETRRAEHGDESIWLYHYFGAAITLWAWWVACNMLGYFLGAIIPPSWQLDFVVPLSFAAVLGPILRRMPYAIAALWGAALGLLLFSLPLKLGLMVACFLGVAATLLTEHFVSWIRPPRSGSQS